MHRSTPSTMLLRASLIWACFSVCCTFGISAEWSYEGATITLAHLNISFTDPQLGSSSVREVGKFGSGAVGAASGLIVVGRPREGFSSGNKRHGCSLPWAATPPNGEPWVALVSRGDCSDHDKVGNALSLNASGVLIYAKDSQAHLQKIALSSFSRRIYGSALQRLQRYPVDPATDQANQQRVHVIRGERGVVVFLAHEQGEQLARMVENGTKVYVSITRGQDVKYRVTNINRTSVLFVSVSFIILMIISLAWLIFYYIQRFRYIHAKDRLARHLCNAAKKALSKIPVKNLKSGDKEVTADNECCAICIEPYQVSDTIRILPCKHQFHKCCVDPWLLEHRTCPMCKMDILKFYGYVFTGSTETVLPMDEVEFEITLSDSEESVLQLDVAEDTSGGDVEAQAPTPPPPLAHPRSSSISQVMVVPRAEASDETTSCEGWSESPVPDTPISPVHQPLSATVPSSAACAVLRSVIDSAKTRVSHSAKVSHSSRTPASSAKSRASRTPSPSPETDLCLEGAEQVDACIQIQDNNDLEIASVCSEDFIDAQSFDELEQSFATTINPSLLGESTALNRSLMTSFEDSTTNPSSATTSVPSSADTMTPSKEESSCKVATLLPVTSSRSRSLSRNRLSGNRTRSTSQRRSSSRARSSSRGRSATRQSSAQTGSASTSRSANTQSRPSSHVVSISHV